MYTIRVPCDSLGIFMFLIAETNQKLKKASCLHD